jgi:hypothetical protein
MELLEQLLPRRGRAGSSDASGSSPHRPASRSISRRVCDRGPRALGTDGGWCARRRLRRSWPARRACSRRPGGGAADGPRSVSCGAGNCARRRPGRRRDHGRGPSYAQAGSIKVEQVMTAQEIRDAGITTLTLAQRRVLDSWLNRYTVPRQYSDSLRFTARTRPPQTKQRHLASRGRLYRSRSATRNASTLSTVAVGPVREVRIDLERARRESAANIHSSAGPGRCSVACRCGRKVDPA